MSCRAFRLGMILTAVAFGALLRLTVYMTFAAAAISEWACEVMGREAALVCAAVQDARRMYREACA